MQFSWRLAIGCTSLGAATLFGIACELVISPDSLQNGECGSGRKACTNPEDSLRECVGLDDPSFQCASGACSPCSLRNAIAICSADGTCAIGSCTSAANGQGDVVEEWSDCNGITGDGCEVDLLHGAAGTGGAFENCGECGVTCALPHVLLNGCNAGSCVVIQCATGFVDCDKDTRNGCEVENDAGSCDAG
jgi:hypothetical protein